MIPNVFLNNPHRLAAAVQVAAFSDRVEIWNPGELLPPLTPDSLRVPHRSITRNHRICEALFLAGYIEKYGTGTLMMIRESVDHALPEPLFKQSGGEFVATIGRDWLTEAVMSRLNLNERQVRIVRQVKTAGRITNQEYQEVAVTTSKTATRDLDDLVSKNVLERVGKTGRGAFYRLTRKQDINETNGTSSGAPANPTDLIMEPAMPRNMLLDSSLHNDSCAHKPPAEKRPERDRTRHAGTKSGLGRDQVALLRKCQAECSISNLMAISGRSNRTKFRDQVLNPLLADGLVEMTVPDHPTSRLQKYRLTAKGRNWLGKARPLARRSPKGDDA